jgi:phosphohistidine phosphatase
MRRLILMRHAKSSWADPGQRDLDRPLNKRGRQAAGLLGAWLKKKGHLPDQALISSARRTQETWSGVVAKLGAAPTSYLPEIYHAGPDTLLETLQRAAGEAKRVLMVGHQPGMGAFAARLLKQPPADPVFVKFPTGATVVIDLPAEAWTGVAWGSGELVDFVVPRALE